MQPERPIYSVSELNAEAKQLLEKGLGTIRLRGEVSQLTVPQSGHYYFILKDEQSEIRCVLFARTIYRNSIRQKPKHGLQVIVEGRLTIYSARGSYQLLVESVQLEDEGALHQKFLQLKHELKTRGYFDDARKKAIPRHPNRVGIVTSSASAAVQDIIRAFSRRNPGIKLLIYPSSVQGETAPREIGDAIELANARDEVDVLLVSRGGGSMEDLAAFNDRIVADAIFNSKIPVVTGIGHQTDVSIADYVADKYLATPTAAAEHLSTPSTDEMLKSLSNLESNLFNQIIIELNRLSQRVDLADRSLKHPRQRIADLQNQFRAQFDRMSNLIGNSVTSGNGKIDVLFQQLLNRSPATDIVLHHHNLDATAKELYRSTATLHERYKVRLETLATQLETMNPAATLDRGYAIIRRKTDNSVVVDSKTVNPGEQVSAQLASGSLDLNVKSVNP